MPTPVADQSTLINFMIVPNSETQLLSVLDDWTRAMMEGHNTDVVYFDFSKAFDTVPHKRLIHKLRTYGIDGKLLDWL